jgi:sugar lactone lactonase YvrE
MPVLPALPPVENRMARALEQLAIDATGHSLDNGQTIRLGTLRSRSMVCAFLYTGWWIAATSSAAVGDLYVSDFSNGLVLKFDAAGTQSTFASGLTGPFGLAFDHSGNLYVADKNTNLVFKFTPTGTKSTFASGLNVPTALVFDAAGNLFVANFSGNAILEFAPDGSRVTFASGLSNPSGLAFDVGGNLYESDYASGMIFRFTPAGTKTMFASGLGHPEEIAFDSGGNLFVCEFDTGSIFEFTPGGVRTIFASGLSGSWGLAFNSAGDLFEADSTSGMVLRFTPQRTKTTFARGIGVPTFLAFEPPPGMLFNISTRMRVLTDNNVLIGGFIITGSDPKNVLIRGIGPSLSSFGIAGALADPTLELHQGSTTVTTNDNWKTRPDGTSQQAEIEATTIPPTNDLESAILATLSPGSYTAILAGKNGGTGVGLVEVYDLGQGANSKLANISTRGFVDTGDNVMIGGLIVGGGTGGGTARLLVRALGPSVPVAGALGDPTLELRDSSGALVAANDNWKTRPDGSSQQAEIEATTIPPTNDLESAIIATVAAGNYTAIVRGKNNTTGVGLVEVYNLQ